MGLCYTDGAGEGGGDAKESSLGVPSRVGLATPCRESRGSKAERHLCKPSTEKTIAKPLKDCLQCAEIASMFREGEREAKVGGYMRVVSEGQVDQSPGVSQWWGLAGSGQSLERGMVVLTPIWGCLASRVFRLSQETSWKEA